MAIQYQQYINGVWEDVTPLVVPSSVTGTWGFINGNLDDQTDLKNALDGKSDIGHNHDGSYEQIGVAAGLISDFATQYEFNFAYGDATPIALVTIPGGKVVCQVEVYIKVPFNGTGATVKIGDAGQDDRLMATNENDLFNIGGNITTPSHEYAIATPVILTINPGAGPSQGSGVIILKVQH